VHGLLPADIPRRILTLAAAAVMPVAAAAVLVLAAPAQAQPGQPAQSGRVSIVIDSMTPQTAKPGSTVTVAGTVTNGTSQTKAGLDVQLLTSPTRFQTRDEMDGYVSKGTGASLEAVGDPFSLAASLRPGATVQWHASFQVDTVGMDQFGVYPVSAQLGDCYGLAGSEAVQARALVALQLEQLKQPGGLARGGHHAQFPARVGQQQPGGGDVKQLNAALGQHVQEVNDVEIGDHGVGKLDKGR